MDHAAKLRGADKVAHTNDGYFVRRCFQIRRQVIARRMRSFLVVMAAPNSSDLIELFLWDDDKLAQTFELQCLDEFFDMGSQIRRHPDRPFDLNAAVGELVIESATELYVVVPHHIFRWHRRYDAFLHRRFRYLKRDLVYRSRIQISPESSQRRTSPRSHLCLLRIHTVHPCPAKLVHRVQILN